MATQLIPQPTSCTLYELEDNLQALVNSIDLAQEPSARELILEEIGQALRKTTEKRGAMVAFLRHCLAPICSWMSCSTSSFELLWLYPYRL